MITVTDENYARVSDILKDRLTERLNRNEEKIKANLMKFEKESGDNIHDLVVNMRNQKMMSVLDDQDHKIKLAVRKDGSYGPEIMTMHDHAISQICAKYDIKGNYIPKLSKGLDWQKDLAAYNMSEHFGHDQKNRFLLRSVGGELRGFLSDSYRRLDSQKILAALITAMKNVQNTRVFDMYTSDTRNWIEIIKCNVFDIPTPNNGVVPTVFGVRAANSDFGDSAHELSFFTLNLACFNGMVSERMIRKIHLGAKLPEDLNISQRTYELDSAAQVSLINDCVRSMFNEDVFQRKISQIQEASAMKVDMDKELKRLPILGVLNGEVEDVKKVLQANKESDGVQGDSTLWRLMQGLSAVGRDSEERRRRELDEITGKLFDRVKLN